MSARKMLTTALLCLFLPGIGVLPGGGGLSGPAPAAAEAPPPINITADRMEYFNEQDLVVFSGNALAVREEVTLAADRMEVTMASGDERDEESIQKIVAKENVSFRQIELETGRERFATGEQGEYLAGERVVTLTGSPKVWEGKNVITGKVMKFFLDDHRFVVEGDKDMPVGLTVYPEKKVEEE